MPSLVGIDYHYYSSHYFFWLISVSLVWNSWQWLRLLCIFFLLRFKIFKNHLIRLILFNILISMRLLLNFLLQHLNSCSSFLSIHECTRHILTKIWVHAIDSIQPEVLQSICVFSESISLPGILGLGSLKTNMLCHFFSWGGHPLFVGHGLKLWRSLIANLCFGEIGCDQLFVIEILRQTILLLLNGHEVILHLIE